MRRCALVLVLSWAAWAGEPERRALMHAAPLVPAPAPTETQHRGVNLTMLDSTQPVSGSGPIVIGKATNASVMLRGPVDDGAAACPPARGEVEVPFKGAQVFQVFNGGKAATQPKSRSPFADDDGGSANAHWRMVYARYCVNISIYKNDGPDPQGTYVLGRARAIAEAVHRGMVEAGLATGGAPTAADHGKALCEEALAAFGIRQPDATHIRRDFADLDSGFRAALERYQKESGQAAFSSVPLAGSARALNWLFAEGGTLNNLSPEYRDLSEEFVFTEPGDANRLLGRQKLVLEGSVSAKPGTEAALLRSIVELHERDKKRVEPGDVFFLALKQVKGDARLATLLAHNTLRSLARGADATLTGVAPNSEFFEKVLAPIRGGPIPLPSVTAVDPTPEAGQPSGTLALPGPKVVAGDPFANDNGGPWYHLFGTAFFELQVQGDFGPVMVAVMGAPGAPPPTLPQGKLDPSSMSRVANTLEQYYREWLSGKVPDPEKYCFNVWGARLGALLSKGLVNTAKPRLGPAGARFPKRPPPGADFDPSRPGVADEAISLPPPMPAPAPAAHANSMRAIDPKGLRKWALFSPASITWEGNGRKMVLDQRTGKLSGYFPVRLTVFPEADGSLGAMWVDTAARPYTLRLHGAGKGELHLVVTEPDGTTRGFVAPAAPGTSYSVSVGGNGPSVLVDKKGAPVREISAGATGCSAQLEQARAAHQEAFSRYTKLATEGGAGDIEQLKEEYRVAYERVQALERQCPGP